MPVAFYVFTLQNCSIKLFNFLKLSGYLSILEVIGSHTFLIEEKLAALEWNLKLLNISMTITHTPVQTLKSMVKGKIVLPTIEKLEKIVR